MQVYINLTSNLLSVKQIQRMITNQKIMTLTHPSDILQLVETRPAVYTVCSKGEVTSFCLFYGLRKAVKVKEGGKISITPGLLVNIYYIVQLFIFICTILPSDKF